MSVTAPYSYQVLYMASTGGLESAREVTMGFESISRCLQDQTSLGEGTRTADAAAFATRPPRTRGAPRPISRTAWLTTHSPRMTTQTTMPFFSAKGGTGLRRHRPPAATGTGSLLLEELELSGPALRDNGEEPPLRPELPPPPGSAPHIPRYSY